VVFQGGGLRRILLSCYQGRGQETDGKALSQSQAPDSFVNAASNLALSCGFVEFSMSRKESLSRIAGLPSYFEDLWLDIEWNQIELTTCLCILHRQGQI
jgi:hypothetical protein